MIYARQSTAIIVTVGPVLDADGVAVTDCVVGDFKASKNGGAPAALNGSATLTHRNTGHYSLSLTTTDVNTVGTLEIVIDDTVNACPMKEIQVVEPAVYDRDYADTAIGYVANASVNVAQFGGSNGTFASGRPEVNVSHWLGTAAATPTVAGVPEIDVTHWNGTAIPAVHTAGYPIVTIKDGTGTGEINTNAGAIALVDLVTDITNLHASAATAAELAKVPKSDSNVTWNATALASINTEADTALTDIHLDHLLAATYDPASKPGAADALLNELVENDAGVARYTANALEQAPTGGSAPTAAEIADAVWDEAQADHVGVGSFGIVASEIADILVDTAVIGAAGAGLTAVPWNASWDAEVQSEVDDALVAQRLDELLNADSDIDGAAPPAVGSVFHELMTKTAGSFTYDQTTDSLEALRDRGDAAWVTATSVTVSDKTGFKLASDGLALVTTWTVDVTGNITGNLSGSVGSVTGNVGGNVTGSVGSLAAQAKADVNAEVLDVLNVDTLVDGKTIAQALIYCGAGIAGRVSGAGTGTEVFLGFDESTTRLTVTVDSSGNRTDIAYG